MEKKIVVAEGGRHIGKTSFFGTIADLIKQYPESRIKVIEAPTMAGKTDLCGIAPSYVFFDELIS